MIHALVVVGKNIKNVVDKRFCVQFRSFFCITCQLTSALCDVMNNTYGIIGWESYKIKGKGYSPYISVMSLRN